MLKKLQKKAGMDTALLLLYVLLFLGLLFKSKLTVNAMLRGLSICAFTVIPSLFPFMVLSELLTHSSAAWHLLKRPAGIFSRLFKLPPCALFAFLFGALCGFPIGARTVSMLFEGGAISKKDASRLLIFCNNTGPAFVIAAIGGRLLGSVKIGVLLYVAQILSALLLAFFTLPQGHRTQFAESSLPLEGRSFSDAVSNSAIAALKVTGFIAFFSTISVFLSDFFKNELLLCFISTFLEVGSASYAIAGANIGLLSRLLLLSFSVSFAGLSVHLQAKSFFKKLPIRFRIYLLGKLCHGILSSLLTLLLFALFT